SDQERLELLGNFERYLRLVAKELEQISAAEVTKRSALAERALPVLDGALSLVSLEGSLRDLCQKSELGVAIPEEHFRQGLTHLSGILAAASQIFIAFGDAENATHCRELSGVFGQN
ncbi:MAG: hypothetical protein EBZ48_06285, partial [Proteobacteria bacterium]|nr:hypothetical protein [Pseudomonadota bacterium]